MKANIDQVQREEFLYLAAHHGNVKAFQWFLNPMIDDDLVFADEEEVLIFEDINYEAKAYKTEYSSRNKEGFYYDVCANLTRHDGKNIFVSWNIFG